MIWDKSDTEIKNEALAPYMKQIGASVWYECCDAYFEDRLHFGTQEEEQEFGERWISADVWRLIQRLKRKGLW